MNLESTQENAALEYRTSIIEEMVGGKNYRLHCISDIENAIDQMFDELNARGAPDLLEELCPYFGSLWPSARALTRWMCAQDAAAFRAARVLELGCGLALPSFVAADLGAAEVTATDLHPDVPLFLKKNLLLNQGDPIRFEFFDWRNKDHTFCATKQDWILGSDILYEKYQATTLVEFLAGALRLGGKAVIVDPDRTYWESLVSMGRQAGLEVSVETLAPTEKKQTKGAVLIQLKK